MKNNVVSTPFATNTNSDPPPTHLPRSCGCCRHLNSAPKNIVMKRVNYQSVQQINLSVVNGINENSHSILASLPTLQSPLAYVSKSVASCNKLCFFSNLRHIKHNIPAVFPIFP